jgi:hypothetical protein
VPALALAVVAIALPDSLNPSLIVAAMYLAVGPRPFRHTLAFTVAAFVVTLAGGLAIALGLGDLVVSVLPKLSHKAKWRVMTAVGVALVGGAVALWWRRESLAADEPPSRHSRGGGRGTSAALAGASIAGIEFLTAFPYFAAIAMIVGSSVSTSAKVSLLVLYCVVYVLPLIAIAVACAVLGQRAERVLRPVGDWLTARWPVIVGPLTATFGAAVMVYGIVQLSSS